MCHIEIRGDRIFGDVENSEEIAVVSDVVGYQNRNYKSCGVRQILNRKEYIRCNGVGSSNIFFYKAVSVSDDGVLTSNSDNFCLKGSLACLFANLHPFHVQSQGCKYCCPCQFLANMKRFH